MCTQLAWADDLDRYIARTKQRPAGKIEPFPKILLPKQHEYQSSGGRDPFLKTSLAVENPHANRPKQALEDYTLDSLRMVGSFTKQKRFWGLIQTPDKKIFPVQVGEYIGSNHGRITSINKKKINIVEQVMTHVGKEKRKVSLTLSNKED